MSERIEVALGERRYDIHVGDGLLAHAGKFLAPFARGPVPVVTDSIVASLYLEPLIQSLKSAGIDPRPIVVDPGESAKSFSGLERLCGALLDTGVGRDGLIVALGGGVIGDLTGLAAGIVKRGIPFAQIPTTLLAQVDSSVGGKTAIDTRHGKNLIGLFHQPRIVVADIGVLTTLPKRERLAGYAEVVKYGALGDADFFAWLEANGATAIDGDTEALTHLIAHSCRMKAAIVVRDERESGERALLNLGHTFAHALETANAYSPDLLHGEAVAVGMALAFDLSVALGLCPPQDAVRLKTHLKAVGLPASLADLKGPPARAGDLLAHMAHDKKAKDGKLTFVLAPGIGKAFVSSEVPTTSVRAVLGS